MYLANPSTPEVRAVMDRADWLGAIITPAQGNRIGERWTWALDNGCFTEAWTPSPWIRAMERHAEHLPRCLFAVVPDAVADPVETRRRWRVWAPVVAELGYPPAYVLQDGERSVPWDEMAALFVGGTTDYKLGPDAYRWTVEARRRGIHVHWGRVNSGPRFAATALTGDSADGTFLAFGPDMNLPRLRSWVNTLPFADAEPV